jgi:hypothetical protein
MEILDFNIYRMRLDVADARKRGQERKSSGTGATGWELVTHDIVISANNIFKESVVTSLPYRTICRPHSSRYSGFMVDEERIIGLNVGAFLLS